LTRILVTGGTGFLGRGILRHAIRKAWDAEMIVYSRDEYKQDLCREKYPDATYILGDVRDYERLMMATRNVDVIIHTAAIKFIPEAEFNVDECIAVNVEGTRNVLRAAYHNSVGHTIGISTDKACLPINTYGMTKALCERLFGEFSHQMFCTMARYGNVIGSTGSVIPRFQATLKAGGSVLDRH
jgi:UDP-N-acetylglucosamine 4,6-dehydratase/5-epimerase